MRRRTGFATLCLVVLTMGTVDLDDAVLADDHQPNAQPIEREMILAMVRDYRQSSNPAWLAMVADAIYEESLRADVDPLLVASIVAKESSFRDRAVSAAGAVGLMQLRPFVADDVADRNDFEWSKPDSLCSPAINVRLGIQYYKELMELFQGDVATALTAYNYGPTLVGRQIRQGTYAHSAYAVSILSMYERLGVARNGEA